MDGIDAQHGVERFTLVRQRLGGIQGVELHPVFAAAAHRQGIGLGDTVAVQVDALHSAADALGQAHGRPTGAAGHVEDA